MYIITSTRPLSAGETNARIIHRRKKHPYREIDNIETIIKKCCTERKSIGERAILSFVASILLYFSFQSFLSFFRSFFFNTDEHISCVTQYNMAVQPSMVMHWKTVSMAKPMLSKLVMPLFGPSQRSEHFEVLELHTWAPSGASDSLSVLHGFGCSPSFTIRSVDTKRKHDRSSQ